jgi:hypothetical protein
MGGMRGKGEDDRELILQKHILYMHENNTMQPTEKRGLERG